MNSLPRDKSSTQQSMFYGLRAPIERALIRLEHKSEAEQWRELLLAIGQIQRRVDENQNWRDSRAISKLPMALFKKAWPDKAVPERVEIARALASLGPPE